MDVVVLGRSGAGKTALIVDGLTELRRLAAGVPGVAAHQSLAQRRRLRTASRQLSDGGTLTPTSRRRVHRIRLTAPDLPAKTIRLIEYPGTVLSAPPGPALTRLEAELRTADAVITAVSALDLQAPPAFTLARVREVVAPLRRALLAGARPVPPVLAVAVTHLDRLPAETDLRGLAAPLDGLEVSSARVMAGLTSARGAAATPQQQALPLLWCLGRCASRETPPCHAGPVTGWTTIVEPWLAAAWATTAPASVYGWPAGRTGPWLTDDGATS